MVLGIKPSTIRYFLRFPNKPKIDTETNRDTNAGRKKKKCENRCFLDASMILQFSNSWIQWHLSDWNAILTINLSLLLKPFSGFKEETDKQVNEVRESIQGINKHRRKSERKHGLEF